MIELPNVTLAIVDCLNYEKAKLSFDHCRLSMNFGDHKFLTHFDVDNKYIVKISKISSRVEYTRFIINDLTKYFDTEYVMVAQWDGFIWNPDLWEDEFLKYDYIGAPWPIDLLKEGVPQHFTVGNGGFSIRSKRLQDFISYNRQISWHPAEDVMICQLNRAYLEASGFTFAPEDVATRFSLENGEAVPRFGAHARVTLVK